MSEQKSTMNTSESALDPPTRYVRSKCPWLLTHWDLATTSHFISSLNPLFSMEVYPTICYTHSHDPKSYMEPWPRALINSLRKPSWLLLPSENKRWEHLCPRLSILIGTHIVYSRGPATNDSDSTELIKPRNLRFQEVPLVILTHVKSLPWTHKLPCFPN